MCGENPIDETQVRLTEGSPPRVRGKLLNPLLFNHSTRITPACAGKTGRVSSQYINPKDHPRVCGENLFLEVRIKSQAGSPPRVRGKLIGGVLKKKSIRITPACAGKTRCSRVDEAIHEDHPRVCGENQQVLSLSRVLLGSPPRVRGKLHENDLISSRVRITPACAGKTLSFVIVFSSFWDHPRVCGEN